MAVFTYKAIGDDDVDVSGTIAADTPRQARDLLRERGLIVRDLLDFQTAESRVSRKIFALPKFGRGRSPGGATVTTFIRELSTLLAVGVPLLEALQTLSNQQRGPMHTAIIVLRDRISAGVSLAGAMREMPRTFDTLCTTITEVGENSGTLDTSLERLAEFRDRSEQLRNRLGTALIYPAIVSLVAIFSTLFLMTFIVPKILEPLIEQGLPLPLPTRIVKGLSDFVVSWWWLLLAAFTTVAMGCVLFVRSETGRTTIDRLILRIPLIGDLVRKQAIVRIAVVMSTLLKSGVVFVQAMQLAQRSTTNRVIREALRRGETAVAAGGEIAAALEQSDAFPSTAVQVFALGQQSGRLEEMLDRLATAYEQQVSTAAQRLTSVLEPVIIIILALIVLFIVLATVLPILEAGNALQ